MSRSCSADDPPRWRLASSDATAAPMEVPTTRPKAVDSKILGSDRVLKVEGPSNVVNRVGDSSLAWPVLVRLLTKSVRLPGSARTIASDSRGVEALADTVIR